MSAPPTCFLTTWDHRLGRLFCRRLYLEGRRIGPYLIQERIGSGGMGVVYRATRVDKAQRNLMWCFEMSIARRSRLRWLMIALDFLATVFNYLDRQTLSVLAPVLQDEFRMSATEYSRIVFLFNAGLHDHERSVRPNHRPRRH
jgi:hypothetical protein